MTAALATSLAGRKALIKVGDGASPEVFSAVLALHTKTFEASTATGQSPVLDKTDPENNPPWSVRSGGAVSVRLSGAGTLAKEDFATWQAWALSGKARNVEFLLDDTGFGSWAGSFYLSSWKVSASYDNVVQVDLTLESSGIVTYTAA